jgi:hypothetical protein
MIAICGDSFAVPDQDYAPMWVDMLEQRLGQPVINLAQRCASNLMISQQVDSVPADSFVIVLFTASTRTQIRRSDAVVPISWHSLDDSTGLDRDTLSVLRSYYQQMFDLELAIYESRCIIESTLQRLMDQGGKFVFDQGGFEHPSYGGTSRYFEKYNAWRSQLCLWDYCVSRSLRPYYHITDSNIHQQIADYYHGLINERA